jgi:hypothetical protein
MVLSVGLRLLMESKRISAQRFSELPEAVASELRAIMMQVQNRVPKLEVMLPIDKPVIVSGRLYRTSDIRPLTNFDNSYVVVINQPTDLRHAMSGIMHAVIEWTYDHQGFDDRQITDVDVSYIPDASE